jgi:drug/metabolite transporter (DMT)-like permease
MAFVAVVFAFRDGLGSAGAGDQWLGDMMALAGGMAWGLTTVVIRGFGLTRMSAEKLLFYQMAVSAICLPFVSLALGEPWNWSWSVFGWVSMLLQVLVGLVNLLLAAPAALQLLHLLIGDGAWISFVVMVVAAAWGPLPTAHSTLPKASPAHS